MSMKSYLYTAGFGGILLLIMMWADSKGDQNTMLLCGIILGMFVVPILYTGFNKLTR